MNSHPTGYPTTMQQHANPMLAAAAGYPVQSGGGQQFPFYANPMTAYPAQVPQARPGAMQQQQQQHSFNPMQIQTSGPGGTMMPSNMVAPQSTSLPYSSPSPYPTSIPTTTSASPPHSQSPTTAATVPMQMTSQNMAAAASPAQLAAQQQQQQRPAPQPNQPPQGQQQQQQQAVPQSPAAIARERARVSTLLEINSNLLQELVNLQAAGKSGGPPQPPTNQEQQSSSQNTAAESNAAGEAPRKPSQEYVECLKRLQCNLVYLAAVTDRNKNPAPSAPAILTPPPHMNNLTEIYSKLNELFSGVTRPAVAHQQRPSQSDTRRSSLTSTDGFCDRPGKPIAASDHHNWAVLWMSAVSLATRRSATRILFAPTPPASALLAAAEASKAGFLATTSSFLLNPGHKLSVGSLALPPRPCTDIRPPSQFSQSSYIPAASSSSLTSSSPPSTFAQAHCSPSYQAQQLRRTHRFYSTSSNTSSNTSANTSPNMNGEARPKRKHSSVPESERPAKHLKPESTVLTPGDETPANGTVYDVENDEDITPILALGPTQADSPEWQATIESVVKSVVSIHFCQTCSFDTDLSMCSQATGFVVDAKRGYILTNRHVVCAGPFWGYCIFDNHEECDVRPVYRDPVHDFGILKFDPKAIKYMDITELKLNPEGAQVGVEIRVVGNDAGEKLSILSGVISRLDRNAPEYGEGYSDFNTNYIQAAAAASGGSSGSPVVNIAGHVVALQAGGRADGAATDYFLPLGRPLRALQCIQEEKPVTRGTIQTQWMIKPFDECRRLGLTPEWEASVRKTAPKETGMLVAEIVLPEGPADGKLQEGDVLLKVNGELLTQFVRLDDILDSNVGKSIRLLIQRGGEDLELECSVGDLHAITPDRFVSVAGGTFHDLSYQQARLYAIATRGVYVCEAAGSFKIENTLSGWIIDTVDKRPTGNLQEFIEVMKTIPDRSKIVISYRHVRDLHTRGTSIIYLDRHWHPKMSLAVRNDKTGLWDFSEIAEPLPAEPPVPRKADFIQLDGVSQTAAADIVRSFVRVSCTMPLKLDGFPQGKKTGYGLVIDAEKGLVVVSRAIVPYDLCDINITVADSIIVTGKVIFMHPLQNYTIVQYDPSLVQAPVRSARLSTENIKQGQDTIFVGFNQNLRIVVAKTTVTDITTVSIPANVSAPRYRAINLDAITVDTGLSSQCTNGVLLRDDGVVQALWLNYLGERTPSSHKDVEYHLGLATPSLLPIISKIQQGEIPKLRILDMESYVIQMSQARIMGVSEEWIEQVSAANPSRHQLFMVRKLDSPPPSFTHHETDSLKEGDIILTLNGKLITRVSEFDIMYDNEVLDALIVRNGEEMHVKVRTVPTEDLETDRAVVFCGAVLQKPHHAVRQQISKLHSEIYVSARSRGSPAYQYGLSPTNFITAVNGVPTRDLDSFVREVKKIPDNTYFRLRAVTFDNVPWVVTMKRTITTMSEYVKDPSSPTGWKVISYPKKDEAADTSNLTADAMDEGTEGGGSDVEPDQE